MCTASCHESWHAIPDVQQGSHPRCEEMLHLRRFNDFLSRGHSYAAGTDLGALARQMPMCTENWLIFVRNAYLFMLMQNGPSSCRLRSWAPWVPWTLPNSSHAEAQKTGTATWIHKTSSLRNSQPHRCSQSTGVKNWPVNFHLYTWEVTHPRCHTCPACPAGCSPHGGPVDLEAQLRDHRGHVLDPGLDIQPLHATVLLDARNGQLALEVLGHAVGMVCVVGEPELWVGGGGEQAGWAWAGLRA